MFSSDIHVIVNRRLSDRISEDNNEVFILFSVFQAMLHNIYVELINRSFICHNTRKFYV